MDVLFFVGQTGLSILRLCSTFYEYFEDDKSLVETLQNLRYPFLILNLNLNIQTKYNILNIWTLSAKVY